MDQKAYKVPQAAVEPYDISRLHAKYLSAEGFRSLTLFPIYEADNLFVPQRYNIPSDFIKYQLKSTIIITFLSEFIPNYPICINSPYGFLLYNLFSHFF